MSVTEIISELPQLTAAERAALRQRQRELNEQDGVQFSHDSAGLPGSAAVLPYPPGDWSRHKLEQLFDAGGESTCPQS